MNIYDNMFWKMAFKMKPDHDRDVIEWEEKGIRRWVAAAMFIPYFSAIYFLGVPNLRIYTLILIILILTYFKISRLAPYVLDRTEEFEIVFEPLYSEREVVETLLEYVETSEAFTVEKKEE